MDEQRYIIIKGAAQHNLKNIDVRIPRDKLVVITGLSGSGKSSLAFDTIYAEGQRRYVESLSAYARQFLEQMQKPDVESVEGLPPTISIEQRTASANPRSTVATTTEIYDYLRLMYARIGKPHCPTCGKPITRQTAQQIVEHVLSFPEGTRLIILAPMVRHRKGEHRPVFERIKKEGFVRARVDGKVIELEEIPKLNKKFKHSIEAVIDRLVVRPDAAPRVLDSVETALRLGQGLVIATVERKTRPEEAKPEHAKPSEGERKPGEGWDDHLFSELYACPDCGTSLPELTPRMFSFNSPYGACPVCSGLGVKMEPDPDLIIPNKDLSLQDGAVLVYRRLTPGFAWYYKRLLRRFCSNFGVSMHTAFSRLPKEIQKILLHGSTPLQEAKYGAEWTGIVPELKERFATSDSDLIKSRIYEYMSEQPCSACHGDRLRPEALAVKVNVRSIADVSRMSITQARGFFQMLQLSEQEKAIARHVLKEINERLTFLIDVGLPYLTLDRRSSSLAGGESERIRLATQVGSGLVGVCYVLDEPTIGLHQRDDSKLIAILRRLQKIGNTVVVVEHDEQMMRAADEILDLGPGAGVHGGKVVAQGTLDEIMQTKESLTGAYLRGDLRIEVPEQRRPVHLRKAIVIEGAAQNNLKNIDIRFPLGGLVCVTGVSGSGKSTLISQILLPALRRQLHNAKEKPGTFRRLLGASEIDKVIEIDQSPIGRTPRSNPATYTGSFNDIRKTFAMTKEARARGYKIGRFSFNVKGGRCEACEGQGTLRIGMHFLPDVYVTCEDCHGTRYARETLDIKYKGKSIADVLKMTIEEAAEFFKNIPTVSRVLNTLNDVGLSYMELGQSATTLSGGEAQRVKLASELGKRATGHTFYVLDEPTTGLHFADVHKLLTVLQRLVDLGNTVVVIEHNMDVIKCADWVIDLGPEGGDEGGQIVAEGRPEQIVQNPNSYTGMFLKQYLQKQEVATVG